MSVLGDKGYVVFESVHSVPTRLEARRAHATSMSDWSYPDKPSACLGAKGTRDPQAKAWGSLEGVLDSRMLALRGKCSLSQHLNPA